MSAEPLDARADWLSYAMVATVLFALWRTANDGALWISVPLYLALGGLIVTRGRWRVKLHLLAVVALLAPVGLLFATTEITEIKGRGGNQFLRSFFLAYAVVELALIQLVSPPSPWARGRVVYLTAAGMLFVSVGLPDYIGTLPGWRDSGPLAAYLGHAGQSPHQFYLSTLAIWGLLALIAFLPRRAPPGTRGARGRAAAWVACAAVSCGLAGGGVYAFRAYYAELANAYYELVGSGTSGGGGFSDEGAIGSVENAQGQDGGREIALRVVADLSPGYLRGRTFLEYAEGRWEQGEGVFQPLPPSGRTIRPETEAPEGEAEVWVYPRGDHGGVIFTPLTTGAVRLDDEAVQLLPGWCLRPYSSDVTLGVPLFPTRGPWHHDAEREAYLALPDDPELVAALRETWATIFAATPEAQRDGDAKVAALKTWFDQRYDYEFGSTFSGEQDPLTEFLREKDHGHCELFASAGTLLLRAEGIPARYTTGFLCLERSPIRERLWVARNRSAHAWIEAYHPQRGWEVVEFTPAGGLPATDPPSSGTALLEALGGWFSELWGALRGRLSELPGRLLGFLQGLVGWVASSPWRWGALLLALAGYVVWRVRKRRPVVRTAPGTYSVALDPELLAQRERFLRLEAALRKTGQPRDPGETVLEFQARLSGGEWPLPDEDRAASLAFLASFAVQRYRGPKEDA